MGSHYDRDHGKTNEILKELRLKSELMTELGVNHIAVDGDVLDQWTIDDLRVQQKPLERQKVTRISIGGHPDIECSEYCTFRGDTSHVIQLLEKTLYAIKHKHKETPSS